MKCKNGLHDIAPADPWRASNGARCCECHRTVQQRYDKSDRRLRRLAQRRERARDAGMCTRCMKRPVMRGNAICDGCLDYLSIRHADKMIGKYQRQIAAWDEGKARGLSYPELVKVTREAGEAA
jgi:hypothetical protein